MWERFSYTQERVISPSVYVQYRMFIQFLFTKNNYRHFIDLKINNIKMNLLE